MGGLVCVQLCIHSCVWCAYLEAFVQALGSSRIGSNQQQTRSLESEDTLKWWRLESSKLLTQVRVPGEAKEFSPLRQLSKPPCAIAYFNIRTLKIPGVGSHAIVWTHASACPSGMGMENGHVCNLSCDERVYYLHNFFFLNAEESPPPPPPTHTHLPPACFAPEISNELWQICNF